MFLINLYSRSVNQYVPVLAPLMVNAVSLQGASHAQPLNHHVSPVKNITEEAEILGHSVTLADARMLLTGLPAAVQQDNRLKALASDFRNAQVKILSFLTYLLRQFPGVIRPHQVRCIPHSASGTLRIIAH